MSSWDNEKYRLNVFIYDDIIYIFPLLLCFTILKRYDMKCVRSLLNDNESVNVLIGSGYDGPAYESYSPLHV